MSSNRMQSRSLVGNLDLNFNIPFSTNLNTWRQLERFTQGGIRLNDKRYVGSHSLLVWFILLIGLYVLRVIVKRRRDDLADDDPLGFWKDRHLIFTISAGRGGSKHLRNVLDCANNVRAFHEPKPLMNGDVTKEIFLKGLRKESFERRAQEKIDAIRRELEGTMPSVAYAETSHMFIKTFADVILHRLGDVANITIINLNRPLSKVIASQLQLGWFSLRHSGLNNWYYDAFNIHPSERILLTNHSSITLQTQIDKLIAYNADVLQRSLIMKSQIEQMQKTEQRWSNVHVVDVNVEHLRAADGISRFLHQLQLEVDERRVELMSMQDDNQRQLKKHRVQSNRSLEEVVNRLKQYAEHAEFSNLRLRLMPER